MGYQQGNRKQKQNEFSRRIEIGRKWEKEVMTEDEDDEEEIDTYKMGLSMMILDKEKIRKD